MFRKIKSALNRVHDALNFYADGWFAAGQAVREMHGLPIDAVPRALPDGKGPKRLIAAKVDDAE